MPKPTAITFHSPKFNSIFIPNAGTEITNTVSHKAKKFNYVASINPCTISSLSGEILDAGSIVDSEAPEYLPAFNNNGSRFIAEFMIVARD